MIKTDKSPVIAGAITCASAWIIFCVNIFHTSQNSVLRWIITGIAITAALAFQIPAVKTIRSKKAGAAAYITPIVLTVINSFFWSCVSKLYISVSAALGLYAEIICAVLSCVAVVLLTIALIRHIKGVRSAKYPLMAATILELVMLCVNLVLSVALPDIPWI